MATEVPNPWPMLAAVPLDTPATAANQSTIVDMESGERLKLGDIVADRVTGAIGSWRFILVYFMVLVAWIAINTVAWVYRWDPYPFIFLNLVLSFQGAFAAPIILMSQNRQETRDRLEAQYDHAVNLQAEREVAAIQARIEELGRASLLEIAALRDEQRTFNARVEEMMAWREGQATDDQERVTDDGRDTERE